MKKLFWAVSTPLILLSCLSFQEKQELAEGYYNIGNVYVEQGDYSKAAAYYRRSLELNPGIYQASFNLARASIELGDYKVARELLLELLEEDESNQLLLEMVAYAYYYLGKNKEAKEYYERILEINPIYSPALRNLVLLEEADGNLVAAKTHLLVLMEHDNRKEYQVLLPELLQAEGRYDEALTKYNEVIELYGGSEEVYLAMKDISYRKEEYYNVIPLLESLITLAKEDREKLGAYYFEKSEVEFLYLENYPSGQKSLAKAIEAGFENGKRIDSLVRSIPPVYREEVDQLARSLLAERQLSAGTSQEERAQKRVDDILGID